MSLNRSVGLFNRISLFAVVLVGLLAFAAQAGAQPGPQQKACAEGKNACALGSNVDALLSSWEAANAETAAMSEADRAQLASQCAAVAKECPIGSRVGFTMKTVRGVLGAAIAAEESCSKSCPSKQAEGNAAAAPAATDAGCEEIKGVLAARSKTLHDMHKLASFAADFTSPSSCSKASCCQAGAQKENSGSKEECASACAIQAAIHVGELKAKWAAAENDMAALTPEKKQALATSFASISEKSKSVALMPQTLFALVQGFETLEQIDTKLNEWGNKNPEFMKSIPIESRISFAQQNAVIAETANVLRSMQGVMAKKCHDAPAGQPVVPASVQN